MEQPAQAPVQEPQQEQPRQEQFQQRQQNQNNQNNQRQQNQNNQPNQNRRQEERMYDFGDVLRGEGVLEIMPDNYGFLRSSDYNYLASPDDMVRIVENCCRMKDVNSEDHEYIMKLMERYLNEIDR